MSNSTQTGHMIAWCPKHGIFPFADFILGGSGQIQMSGGTAKCPRCGTRSEVISGTYKAGIDRVSLLLDDPNIHPDASEAVRKLARRAQAGEITIEEAKREAEKVDPKFGELFNILSWSPEAKAILLGAIITASAQLLSAKISEPQITVINKPVIERVIEKEHTSSTTAVHVEKAPQPSKHKRPKLHKKKR
jgi:hypothetical protein